MLGGSWAWCWAWCCCSCVLLAACCRENTQSCQSCQTRRSGVHLPITTKSLSRTFTSSTKTFFSHLRKTVTSSTVRSSIFSPSLSSIHDLHLPPPPLPPSPSASSSPHPHLSFRPLTAPPLPSSTATFRADSFPRHTSPAASLRHAKQTRVSRPTLLHSCTFCLYTTQLLTLTRFCRDLRVRIATNPVVHVHAAPLFPDGPCRVKPSPFCALYSTPPAVPILFNSAPMADEGATMVMASTDPADLNQSFARLSTNDP